MNSRQQDTSQMITSLKHNVDCLMIRVNSCQQYIEKLLTIARNNNNNGINESINNNLNIKKYNKNDKNEQKQANKYKSDRNCQQSTRQKQPKFTSLDSIQSNYDSIYQPSLDKQNNCKTAIQSNKNTNAKKNVDRQAIKHMKRSMPQTNILNQNKKYQINEIQDKKQYDRVVHDSISNKVPSFANLLLIPPNRSQKQKQVQSGSFSLIKNAILINIHQIQKLQQNYEKLKLGYDNKFQKNEQAIQLMTKLLSTLENKVSNFADEIIQKINIKKKSRGNSSRKMNKNNQNIGYNTFTNYGSSKSPIKIANSSVYGSL